MCCKNNSGHKGQQPVKNGTGKKQKKAERMNKTRQNIGLLKAAGRLCREIYHDRRLLLELSLKDVRRRFSGTYFGLAWGLWQPLMTILVYWLVFQYGFRSGDVGGMPFVLWFISGIISWLYISEAFSCASSSFLEYSYLIQKVKFNINILPLVKILSGFYIHIFFFVIVLAICILFGCFSGIMLLQAVYYMLAEIVFVYALSLITSSVMVFFRDLNQIIGILLMIGMWGTPIAWNMEMFPAKVQLILKLNPIYYLVEGYRDALLGRRWFWERPVLGAYFWILTSVIFLAGIHIYTRLRPYFADTV